MDWHPLPLTPATKKALMDGFSHYQNFSYEDRKGFVVEVPIPPGLGKIPRATFAVLKDQVEVNISLTRGGNLLTHQPKRPLEECYSWWLGQLIHYGLELGLSVDEAKFLVKTAMVQGTLKVPEHLKKMEQRMRTAANRRAKKRGYRLAAQRAVSEERRSKIKQESNISDSDDDSDSVQTPALRTRRDSRLKREFEDTYSPGSDSETDSDQAYESSESGTITKVPLPKSATTKIKTPARNIAMSARIQIKQAPTLSAEKKRKAITNSSSESTSFESESESGQSEDTKYGPFATEQDQDDSVAGSDYDDSHSVVTAIAKENSISESSDEDNSDEERSKAGSFSGDSEYERAVMANSQNIHGASTKYGDTDSSSASSSDEELGIPQEHQQARMSSHKNSQAMLNASMPSATKKTSKFTRNQPAKSASKQLEIKRDRNVRPNELERLYSHEQSPTPATKFKTRRSCVAKTATTSNKVTTSTLFGQARNVKLSATQKLNLNAVTEEAEPKSVLKRRSEFNGNGLEGDLKRQKQTKAGKEANLGANVHPDMTYDDIFDPSIRSKAERMCDLFPRESVHFCYTCLAKHNGDYEKACDALVEATSTLTPIKTTRNTSQKEVLGAHTTASSNNSRIPSPGNPNTAQKSAGRTRRDVFALSDSDDDVIFKREPKSDRKGAPTLPKRVSIISDAIHGSKIDLISSEDDESSTEGDNKVEMGGLKHERENRSHQKSSSANTQPGKFLRAVSVEIPSSASKPRAAKDLMQEEIFPSSPSVAQPLKGILKTSPSFRPRNNYLDNALESFAQTRLKHMPQLPREPPQPRNTQDYLVPQAKKTQQALGLQPQLSSHSYTTASGWQALNPNRNNKIRPSGKLEEESQPEPRRSLFP